MSSMFNMTFSPAQTFPQFCPATTDMTVSLGTKDVTKEMRTAIMYIGWSFNIPRSSPSKSCMIFNKTCQGALRCDNGSCSSNGLVRPATTTMYTLPWKVYSCPLWCEGPVYIPRRYLPHAPQRQITNIKTHAWHI